MGHQIMWGAKELLRGVGMEAGHAPHIDVCVRFYLEAEYAHLVALFEQRAPVRVKPLIDPVLKHVVLVV